MADPPALWLRHFPASEWGKTANAKDPGQLTARLRDRYWTLREAMRAQGLRCEVASGYRTPYQQYVIRRGRVPAGLEFTCPPMGSPTTACPGRSRHQTREAVDVDTTQAGYDYLRDHAGLYGLAQTVRNEPWHLQAAGSPVVPIIRYPGPSWDDQEAPMALSDADVNKIALVTAATVLKVLQPELNALGLKTVAGVDRILQDDLQRVVAETTEALAHQHGPA